MKRNESQDLESEYKKALNRGQVTECIADKCVCWASCVKTAKLVPGCMYDLSTGFYHQYNAPNRNIEPTEYRDPSKGKGKAISKRKGNKKH